MTLLSNLKVHLYADGADIAGIKALAALPYIKGFTTNPSLMRKAGVSDYRAYAAEVLPVTGNKPISFEVFADDLPTMEAQAKAIAAWGPSIYVKIPVINSQGASTAPIIRSLSTDGIKLNITAIFTLEQVAEVAGALAPNTPAIVSVFAGRLADSGIDPMPIMLASKAILSGRPNAYLLWAATREVYNVIQADQMSCPIITVPNDILAKLGNLGRSPLESSLDTVRTFLKDTQSAGFTIPFSAQDNA